MPMSAKTRRASVSCSTRILIDFLRRSRRNRCSVIASSPLRSRISTDGRVQSAELIHHQFFDYLLMSSIRSTGVRSVAA